MRRQRGDDEVGGFGHFAGERLHRIDQDCESGPVVDFEKSTAIEGF